MPMPSLQPVKRLAAPVLEVPEGIWLGTPECQSKYFSTLAAVPGMAQAGMFGDPDDDSDGDFGDYSFMLTRYGSVAVMDVSGAIAMNQQWWHRFVGVTSYQAIANAAITAAKDREISSILLRVDSGGGVANGISDCTETLKYLSENVLPIYAYIAGQSFSAAYWLTSLSSRIFVNELSGAGSIGALMVQVSEYRRLVELGVDAEIIRSQEYKAAGHPAEKLSEKHRAELQANIDYMGDIFAANVARNRRTSVTAINSQKARLFYGQRAIDAGLADEMLSYERVLARLKGPESFNNTAR